MSNDKTGENPVRRKPKVSWGREIRPGLAGTLVEAERRRRWIAGQHSCATDVDRWRDGACKVSGTIRNVRGQLGGGGQVNPPPQANGLDRPHLCSGSDLKRVQEKLLRVEALVTVLKLTQVGETRSLRRSGEHWLRNSANWPRKFAIRGASGGSRLWGPQ
jgi:hypothetical protein